jgi:5-methylcytosine-specific restriction endonuclease McrA
MSRVFVLNTDKTTLNPVHPAWARKLLKAGQAAVFKRFPFTIILKQTVLEAQLEPLRLKLDPGSKTTGIAIVNDATGEVVFAAELEHRSQAIHQRLLARLGIRRGRRARHTRYRPARFLNRQRIKGWLPPSLMSRVFNIVTWVRRLARLCPIRAITQELVKFDTQLMQNALISGVEYQQGELAGYEVREYLLDKWERKCAYCGKSGLHLQVEHIIPKARGGSNRVSNLTIACEQCSQAKGTQTANEFGYPKIQAQAKVPLRDTAAVNATRWKLYHSLSELGLPVETGSGGLTKYNRSTRGLAKSHWLDAVCTGRSTPAIVKTEGVQVIYIKACGHGNRQMCLTDRYGFPKSHRSGKKSYLGYQTGDIVTAKIPCGKYAGEYTGRIAIRQRAKFRLNGLIDVHPKYLRVVQRNDGYMYQISTIVKGVDDTSPVSQSRQPCVGKFCGPANY